ncbi:hypothetical protein ACIQUM_37430 [Amycolatopsis azurea]|uniref:hypothetical protein n=1 Tax=Amycolatopsis azurea TaxID=36819 RepID=UPI0037FE9DD8
MIDRHERRDRIVRYAIDHSSITRLDRQGLRQLHSPLGEAANARPVAEDSSCKAFLTHDDASSALGSAAGAAVGLSAVRRRGSDWVARFDRKVLAVLGCRSVTTMWRRHMFVAAASVLRNPVM